MRSALLPCIAFACLLIAGCTGLLGSPETDYEAIDEEIQEDAFPLLVQDHGDAAGHFDAALHNGSMNLRQVAYHNGHDESGDPNAIPAGVYFTELAITDEYAYLARAGALGGFTILDIRDAAAPHHLGSFDALGGSDIEVSDDEQLAFFSTQRNMPQDILNQVQSTQNPFSGVPRGIYVVDIEDKTAPSLSNFVPLPVNGPHTLTYHRHLDGNEYLVVCTYDLVTDPGTGAIVGAVPVTQRVIIYQVARGDDGAALVPVSKFEITDSAPQGRLYFPHDTRIQVHPVTNQTLLYVAYWDKGVRILDWSDPTAPTEIGSWTEFAPSSRNNIHLAGPFDERIDGRHVTVTEPEIVNADETGYFTFLDTTDPTDPQKISYWTLPSELIVQNLDFSPHNFDTWDGKLALAHNHAGLWVVDVSTPENLQEPRSVAYFMPAEPRTDSPRPQPFVWGVFENRDLLWLSDEATGLYVLEYTGP